MIQGGDPDSKNAKPGQLLGDGGLNYTIPPEFNTSLFHKKGVLAAARESDVVNPKKESSSTQFYIVQGKQFTDSELNKLEEKKNKAIFEKKLKELGARSKEDTLIARNFAEKNVFKYTKKQRKAYKRLGGAPHLDQNYTVFGEVKEGIEVVDKIANLQTDNNDRPLEDIRFTIIMKNKND
jgi:peptidyl-prolyl cis-trans isomerase B (cyclophilin B)